MQWGINGTTTVTLHDNAAVDVNGRWADTMGESAGGSGTLTLNNNDEWKAAIENYLAMPNTKTIKIMNAAQSTNRQIDTGLVGSSWFQNRWGKKSWIGV